MTIAEDLLRRHIETLVADNARWQMLLAEDVVWELPFATGRATEIHSWPKAAWGTGGYANANNSRSAGGN